MTAASLVAAPSAAAMSFQAVRLQNPAACRPACPVVIVADGEITDQTAQDFVAFVRGTLQQASPRNVVLVNSPGGNVRGSIELGRVWRQLGTVVIVARPTADGTGLAASRCFSACVFAIMGARKRLIPSQSRLAVHQMHTIQFERDIAEGGRVNRQLVGSNNGEHILRQYARSMGIDPAIVSLAQSIPPSAIHVLRDAEIRRYRLGTQP
jgi:hypothetical protein